jgi:hypothetical protein
MMRRYPYSNSSKNNKVIDRVQTMLSLFDDMPDNVFANMKSRYAMYSFTLSTGDVEYEFIAKNAIEFIKSGFEFNDSVSMYFALMRLGISKVILELRRKYRLIVWQNDILLAVVNCGDHMYGKVDVGLNESNDKMFTSFRLLADDYDDYYLYSHKKNKPMPTKKIKTFALKIESLDDLPDKTKFEFEYLWIVLGNDFSKFNDTIATFKPRNLILSLEVVSGNTLDVACLSKLELNHLIIDESVWIKSNTNVKVKYLTICNPAFERVNKQRYKFLNVDTTSDMPHVSLCRHEFYTQWVHQTTCADLNKIYGIPNFGESLQKHKNNLTTSVILDEYYPVDNDVLTGVRKQPYEIMNSSKLQSRNKFRQLQSALVFELSGAHDWRDEFKLCVSVAEYPYKEVSKHDEINTHICTVVANMQTVDPLFNEAYKSQYTDTVKNTSTKYLLTLKRELLLQVNQQ